MAEKDPSALSADAKANILKCVEVTVIRKLATLRFAPEDIEIVKEGLRNGGFFILYSIIN